MAGLVVVDTDLVIDFLRGKGTGAGLVRGLIVEHRLRLTAVTAFELRVGASFLDQRDDILGLLRKRTFPLDQASALLAGEVAADLHARGEEIGVADTLQAGICLRHNLPFATRNRSHFARVNGLDIVDLTEGE